MSTTRSVKSRDKVRAHRERLRRRGLRPIQIWVPDVRSRTFAREAHRQSLLVGADALGREEQGFVDAVSDWPSHLFLDLHLHSERSASNTAPAARRSAASATTG